MEQKKIKTSVFPLLAFFLFILLAYAPFMGDRVLRVAGDDKVYVAQALEMEKRGDWFVQTLAEEPDYRKGPFHYILLRLGMLTMGKSMWATVYMNLVMVLLASFALFALVERNTQKHSPWAFFTGTAFALNAGIYPYSFASQMEVELASLIAISLFFLDRAPPDGKKDWQFWLVAGLAGAVKSPLHAALMGLGAILFWLFTGEWNKRIKSISNWLGLLAGILLCIFAYAPMLLLDYENFFSTYIMRETLGKGYHGRPWHVPIVPLLTHSLIPWMFIAFVAYGDGLWRSFSYLYHKGKKAFFSGENAKGLKRISILGISIILPSLCFFIVHPYRVQNYNLPVISGVILLMTALIASSSSFWNKIYRGALFLTALKLLVIPIFLSIVVKRYEPMPPWWSPWVLPVLWVGSLWTVKAFLEEAFFRKFTRPDILARSSATFFVAIAMFLSVAGEREMLDLRNYYEETKVKNQNLEFTYYNLHKNIWSEWGYLNFWVGFPISGIHREEQLQKAIEETSVILVPGKKHRADLLDFVDKYYPGYQYSERAWKRWQTKGKDHEGISVWKQSWRKQDFTPVEKTYSIIRFFPPGKLKAF